MYIITYYQSFELDSFASTLLKVCDTDVCRRGAGGAPGNGFVRNVPATLNHRLPLTFYYCRFKYFKRFFVSWDWYIVASICTAAAVIDSRRIYLQISRQRDNLITFLTFFFIKVSSTHICKTRRAPQIWINKVFPKFQCPLPSSLDLHNKLSYLITNIIHFYINLPSMELVAASWQKEY